DPKGSPLFSLFIARVPENRGLDAKRPHSKVFDFSQKKALQVRIGPLICAPHDRHIAQLVRAPP
ncbi:hypothetical protein, partial [Pseudomonas sp. GLN_2]|uniref:hypothetical protein n=1 Tax=Pseudomonas sp. GLN_2 TaxID=3367180 RepID=UPI00370A9D4D